jgi:hypothetical protein
MFRMPCEENSAQTAHTFVHISRRSAFAHINVDPSPHSQKLTGFVDAKASVLLGRTG